MFIEKLKELEEKVRQTVTLVHRLREEKRELERQLLDLHYEVEQLKEFQERFLPTIDGVLHQLDVVNNSADESFVEEPPEVMEVAEIDPEDYETHFELGVEYEKRGWYEKAIAEYEKVLKARPDHIDATEHLAFLLEKLNRGNEASVLWGKALSLKRPQRR